jgi:hypothetical protein
MNYHILLYLPERVDVVLSKYLQRNSIYGELAMLFYLLDKSGAINSWNVEAKPGWLFPIITLQPTPHPNHQEGKKATTNLQMLRIYSAEEEKKFKEDSNAQTADPSMSILGAN